MAVDSEEWIHPPNPEQPAFQGLLLASIISKIGFAKSTEVLHQNITLLAHHIRMGQLSVKPGLSVNDTDDTVTISLTMRMTKP